MSITKQRKAAQDSARKAIDQGFIRKLPCYKCGNTVSVAHHPDYNIPLYVKFFCHRHHALWHKRWKAKRATESMLKLTFLETYALGIEQLNNRIVANCLSCDCLFLPKASYVEYCNKCLKG